DAREGKMYGVLVVAHAGRVGFIRAFSGMLDGSWQVDGFAPPAFDVAARDAFWPAGERELAEIDAALAELAERAAPVQRELAEATARSGRGLAELRARHRERRGDRHALRAVGGDVRALDQQSRGDTAERRRFDADRRAVLAPLEAHAGELASAIAELERT